VKKAKVMTLAIISPLSSTRAVDYLGGALYFERSVTFLPQKTQLRINLRDGKINDNQTDSR
jgi:hypothetical protein